MLFGPLAQFDLLEKTPTCCYDIFMIFIGQTEFDNAIFFLTFFLFGWQFFEYYNEEVKLDNIIDFDDEIIINDIITKKNFNYADFISGFFALILICNLAGIFPYSQTITAQIIFTLVLSIISIITIWTHSIYDNKLLMLNHFLPNGSPLIITPFIIIIEVISNISRVISLSVRLFANMTSGHALLKIIASFGLIALNLLAFWKILIIFPILIIFIITMLELLIAFLQTYVFVTLLLIYVSETE